MASKVKTIVLLRAGYFSEEMRADIERWLNDQMSYDRYKVQIVDFLATDPYLIKSHEVGEKDIV